MSTWGSTLWGIGGAPIVAAPAVLPNGMTGSAYSQALTATGGTPPYTWAIASGALPTGTTLSVLGVISGSPTVAGTFNFNIVITDAAMLTAGFDYSIVITAFTLPPPPSYGLRFSNISKPGVTWK
ncbi:MAG: hypothetical protein NVS9B4_01130 [Candidatus Acidiferrum sp.]